jgi:formyltetrahydrofolate-dependent phosphoribosylglycinamide formyltransferase
VSVAAVGSDRESAGALDRARAAGVPTFCLPLDGDREAWDAQLAETVASFDPDLVVSAGFMRLVGRAFLERYAGRLVNSHPSLLPAFPGMHAARDALAYGVRVTGCTLFLVDGGVDSGPIAQAAVPVLVDDDEATLHERIKVEERRMLVDAVGRMLREGFTVTGRKVTIGVSEVA